jgi:hypothetical protein
VSEAALLTFASIDHIFAPERLKDALRDEFHEWARGVEELA